MNQNKKNIYITFHYRWINSSGDLLRSSIPFHPMENQMVGCKCQLGIKCRGLNSCMSSFWLDTNRSGKNKVTHHVLNFYNNIWFWKRADPGKTLTLQTSLTGHFHVFWYKWEASSRKVSVKAFNFSPTPWNLWPVMSQAVPKFPN